MKEEKVYRFIGCNRCHRASGEKGVTLIKAPDSYYCKQCYNILKKEGKIK